MNDWTKEEMDRLQTEAKNRVMEMREKSKFAAEDMDRDINCPCTKAADKRYVGMPEEVKAIKMPVVYPEKTKTRNRESAIEAVEKRKDRGLLNLFGELGEEETEKLFILSLCLLLDHEKADEEVILALMYILT